jgi:hypothetical protein
VSIEDEHDYKSYELQVSSYELRVSS